MNTFNITASELLAIMTNGKGLSADAVYKVADKPFLSPI